MFGGDKIYIESIPGESRETLRTNDHAKNVLKWKPTNNVGDWIDEFKTENT